MLCTLQNYRFLLVNFMSKTHVLTPHDSINRNLYINRDVNNLAIDRTAHAPTYERNP